MTKPAKIRGDEIVSWDDLYKGGRKTGRDANACVITNLTPLQAECTITFVVAGGTITAQYMGTPPPRKIAAVTGGTGKYLGARGQVVIVESGSDANVRQIPRRSRSSAETRRRSDRTSCAAGA